MIDNYELAKMVDDILDAFGKRPDWLRRKRYKLVRNITREHITPYLAFIEYNKQYAMWIIVEHCHGKMVLEYYRDEGKIVDQLGIRYIEHEEISAKMNVIEEIQKIHEKAMKKLERGK